MKRWRIAVVALLLAVPLAVLAGLGSYHVWTFPYGWLAWWPMAACMGAGYLLAVWWQRGRKLLPPLSFDPPTHWPERDRLAWKRVAERADLVGNGSAGDLVDPEHYLKVGRELAADLATVYYSRPEDAVERVTVPELLTVVELAAHDLWELVDRYVPGGHLLTVRDWRHARKVADWYRHGTNLYWIGAALLSPIHTAVRYAASRLGLTLPLQRLQENLLQWFGMAFVNRVGYHLVELYSGRLKVGAERYRELLAARLPATASGTRLRLSRWRTGIVAALVALPFLALVGAGVVFLIEQSWGLLTILPLAGALIAGVGLGTVWRRRLLRLAEPVPVAVVSEQDKLAGEVMQAHVKAAEGLRPEALTDPAHYLAVFRQVAEEVATVYAPRAKDPLGDVTIPESLAVVELVAHDLTDAVRRYVPAGHLLTIRNWRQLKSGLDFGRDVLDLVGTISMLVNPVQATLQRAARSLALNKLGNLFKQNLLLGLYTTFLERLGRYLIDLHGGRLRLGADHYRAQTAGPEEPAEPTTPEAATVTVVVLGQAKAGKSSLINALLGEQRAKADVVPTTSGVDRYELTLASTGTKLVLLDTPGYAQAGPRADHLAATREAARQADLLLYVTHALNPGRQPDVTVLDGLKTWFAERPDRKLPPILGVVTHVDLLSPSLEWSPPYRWQEPARPKEKNIRAAVEAVANQFGERLRGIVPVCTALGKVWGIDDGLLPAVAQLLDEAHGVALLRVLRAEADTRKARQVLDQVLASGREGLRLVWEAMRNRRP